MLRALRRLGRRDLSEYQHNRAQARGAHATPQGQGPVRPVPVTQGKRKRSGGVWRVVFVVSLIVFLCAAGALAFIGYGYWHGQQNNKQPAQIGFKPPGAPQPQRTDPASLTLHLYAQPAIHPAVGGGVHVPRTTRNFPNREGSKPGEGQMSSVALMDARSIAATAANGGKLTAATDLDVEYTNPEYHYNASLYEKRVYNGWGKAEPDAELRFGPNIKDWPEMPALTDDLLVKVCTYITDPVTTTDELIPSGETSSYRSNPERLSEFALSRRDPQYVSRSKVMRQIERDREAGKALPEEVLNVYAALTKAGVKNDPAHTDIGSTIFANMPGDGSAREQAASCQRVMGASANFAKQYATKRYRSNCINWGMTPFLVENPEVFELGDYIFVPGIREAVLENKASFTAYAVKPDGTVTAFPVSTGALTEPERQIIADGCLINYYRNNQ